MDSDSILKAARPCAELPESDHEPLRHEQVQRFIARTRRHASEVDERVRALSLAIRLAAERTARFKSADGAELTASSFAMRDELVLHGEELLVAEEEIEEKAARLADAQAALDAERLRFRLVFDAAPDAFVVTTTDGAITEANAAATRLLNVTRHDARRTLLLHFVARQDTAKFRDLMKEVLKEGAIGPVSLRVRTRGGPVVTVGAIGIALRHPAQTIVRWTLRAQGSVASEAIARSARASIDAVAKLLRAAIPAGGASPCALEEMLGHADAAAASLAVLEDGGEGEGRS